MRYIRYLLCVFADTRIYPHLASRCHAQPKAANAAPGIEMLRQDKFPYPYTQGVTNIIGLCYNGTRLYLEIQQRNFINAYTTDSRYRLPTPANSLFYPAQKEYNGPLAR